LIAESLDLGLEASFFFGDSSSLPEEGVEEGADSLDGVSLFSLLLFFLISPFFPLLD